MARPRGSRPGHNNDRNDRAARRGRGAPLDPLDALPDISRRNKMNKHIRYETSHCCKCNGLDAGAAKPTAGSTDADRPIWLIWLSV